MAAVCSENKDVVDVGGGHEMAIPKSMEERHRSISNPSKRKGNGDDPTAGLLGNSLSNDVWAEKKEHGQCVFGIMPL